MIKEKDRSFCHDFCNSISECDQKISDFRLRLSWQCYTKGKCSRHLWDTRIGRRQRDRTRSQDGFNEDRRICPIKMSCKDPHRSMLVHSQNIEIRPHRNSLFLSMTTSTNSNCYPFRYRYWDSPLEPSKVETSLRGQRGFEDALAKIRIVLLIPDESCKYRISFLELGNLLLGFSFTLRLFVYLEVTNIRW